VEVHVRARGLAPGFHGFHVHESGVCDPNAREQGRRMPFASAGAHYARGDVPHGEHAGDLPPLPVGEGGIGSYTVVTERFDVDDLLGGDGTAFVVHAEPDNLANIPRRYVVPAPGAEGGPDRETLEAGDSGDRVACGKVTRA
jgi:Cu-Zn family superoxide dismutase